MPKIEEILEFNAVRQKALQELAKYKGSRISTYKKKSINGSANGCDFYEYEDMKYKLRNSTAMYRKPDLTKERVDNIISYTRHIEKYDPKEANSIEDAYDFLRGQLHEAYCKNKSISSKYGKYHMTFNEAFDTYGVLGLFKRTCFQAQSDLAFERAIAIVEKVHPVYTVHAKTAKA